MSLTEILQSFESQKYCSHYLLIAEVEQPHVHWIYYYLNRQKRQSFFFSFLGNICMYSLGEGIMEQFSHGNSIPAALIFFSLVFEGGSRQRQRMQSGLCRFSSEIALCIWWKNFFVPVWISTSKMQRSSAGNCLSGQLQRWANWNFPIFSFDHNEK